MKIVMKFDVPDDERFLKGEMNALAHRMFEAATNVAVDPFISEELFESRSLDIDDKRYKETGSFTISFGLGESDPVPFGADDAVTDAAFEQAKKRHDEAMEAQG